MNRNPRDWDTLQNVKRRSAGYALEPMHGNVQHDKEEELMGNELLFT